MPSLDESYPEMSAALAGRYGRSAHAPDAGEPFRRVLGVALGRAVGPEKGAGALTGLAEAGLIPPEVLAEADDLEVSEAARQAGVSLPAPAVRTLKRLARWVVDRYRGSGEAIEEASTGRLREELVALNGVGPATADAILLLALGRPAYPVDRASYRIFARHGWIDPTADYDEARDTLERPALGDAAEIHQLADWLDRIGRDFCRPSAARCDRCPLQPFLPEGGPIEPDAG